MSLILTPSYASVDRDLEREMESESPAMGEPRYQPLSTPRPTLEQWLEKAHHNAPPLPWIGDNGEEVCSFVIVPLSELGGAVALLLDAHGNEIVRSGLEDAINATCLALNPTPWEVTFLPQTVLR